MAYGDRIAAAALVRAENRSIADILAHNGFAQKTASRRG